MHPEQVLFRVTTIEILRKHIRKMTQDPIKIIAVKVERTVHRGKKSSGHEFSLDERHVRNQTLSIYTPDGIHGRCFCQLCRKVKPYDLMEVNNILADPKYFFPQTRIALCLECSKRFEAIRLLYAQKSKHGDNPFVAKLKHAQIGSAGYIDIPIGKETIRFTATHLAEIQEILRTMPR